MALIFVFAKAAVAIAVTLLLLAISWRFHRYRTLLLILAGIFQAAFGLTLARLDIFMDAGRLHVMLR